MIPALKHGNTLTPLPPPPQGEGESVYLSASRMSSLSPNGVVIPSAWASAPRLTPPQVARR